MPPSLGADRSTRFKRCVALPASGERRANYSSSALWLMLCVVGPPLLVLLGGVAGFRIDNFSVHHIRSCIARHAPPPPLAAATMSLNSLSSLFQRKSSAAATSPTPTLTRSATTEEDSLALVEERLGSLCESISKGVVPGLERELGTVRPSLDTTTIALAGSSRMMVEVGGQAGVTVRAGSGR